MNSDDVKISFIIAATILLVITSFLTMVVINHIADTNRDIAEVEACKSINNSAHRLECIAKVTKPSWMRNGNG